MLRAKADNARNASRKVAKTQRKARLRASTTLFATAVYAELLHRQYIMRLGEKGREKVKNGEDRLSSPLCGSAMFSYPEQPAGVSLQPRVGSPPVIMPLI